MATTDEDFEKIIKEIDEKEAAQKSMSSETSSYPHEELMKQEGMNEADLPDDIKKMITVFNSKKEKAVAKKANQDVLLDIQKLSALISKKIMILKENKNSEENNIGAEDNTDVNLLENGGDLDFEGIGQEQDVENEDEHLENEDEQIASTEVEENGGKEEVIAEKEDWFEKKGFFDGILGIFNW